MAHLHKRSLLSRLFPHEDRSSEDFSSSTLFAHVSSPGQLLSSISRKEQTHSDDLFRACFANFSSDTARSQVHKDKPVGGDAVKQLQEAFAKEGVEVYTAAVEKLAAAQQDITSQISDFGTLSSSMATDLDDLYANLSYPLSTTLCSSKNFPRATIEAHLATLKEDVKRAAGELHDLECRWQDNFRSEQKLRLELLNLEGNPGQGGGYDQNDENYSQMVSFKQETERIVAERARALDEIEEEYKEGVQALTMKMMQAMRAD